LNLPAAVSEHQFLRELRTVASRNQAFKSYIGLGYYDCHTPSVILRNVLENPGWYTPYTPYQAEIAQGRLEALLTFQTMVRDLTGMEVATASLLDEATAAAEVMTMLHRVHGRAGDAGVRQFFVADSCFPQTIDVLRTRAEPLGIELVIGDLRRAALGSGTFGALVQTPDEAGSVHDLREFIAEAKRHGILVAVASDLLSLTLLTPPGELGADVVLGNSQRFGVPLGYGGPHAALFSTLEAHVRQAPGRMIGVSIDAAGNTAYRMALQTREQHIRREKATSNICTAQALLANMAAFFAVFHGPEGLTAIASRVHAPAGLGRTSPFLTHPVFHRHRSELEMMRFIRDLERKDLGLHTAMIPLGSCTMKLNAATEMLPVTWPEFSKPHPFIPVAQAEGYHQVFRELEEALCQITGLAAVSLQPNSGAQGE